MTSLDLVEPVDVLGIAVESQRFQVAAAVSDRVQLGLAEEFVVSLVATLESVGLNELRRFFDFPDDETVILIEWLIGDEYLELHEGQLRLGRKALSALQDVDENGLRAITSRVVNESISLELLGGSIVGQLQSTVGSHVPVIRGSAAQDLRALVEQTVARHFREWTSGWSRKGDDLGEYLYRVLDVEPQARFRTLQPIPLALMHEGKRLAAELDFSLLLRRGVPGSRDQLVSGLRHLFLSTSFPKDTQAALDLVTGFDDGALSSYERLGKFDLRRWVFDPRKDRSDGASFTGSIVSTIGAKLVSTISPASAGLGIADAKKEADGPPVLWVRPSTAFWGTAPGFASSVASVVKAADPRGVVLITRETDQSVPRGAGTGRGLIGLTGSFREALVVADDCFPESLELIVNPGRWVLATVYQPCSPDGLPVPAAHLSINTKGSKKAARIVLDRLNGQKSPPREIVLTPNDDSIMARLNRQL